MEYRCQHSQVLYQWPVLDILMPAARSNKGARPKRTEAWGPCQVVCYRRAPKCKHCSQCKRHCNCRFLIKREKERKPLKDLTNNRSFQREHKLPITRQHRRNHSKFLQSIKAAVLVDKEVDEGVNKEVDTEKKKILLEKSAVNDSIVPTKDKLQRMLDFFKLQTTKNFPGQKARLSSNPMDVMTSRGLKVSNIFYYNVYCI